MGIKILKLVDKPNSVSGSCRMATIYLRTALQLSLSDLPGTLAERTIPYPCLILLREGFARLPTSRSGRCALTLLPLTRGTHHFTLIPISIGTVSFLWHFPACRRPSAGLPVKELPVLRSSDFPPRVLRSGCLTNFRIFPPHHPYEFHWILHPSRAFDRKIRNE